MGKSGNSDSLKSRTVCWNCDQQGHISKECTKPRRQTSSRPPTPVNTSIPNYPSATPKSKGSFFMFRGGSGGEAPGSSESIFRQYYIHCSVYTQAFVGIQIAAGRALVDTAAEDGCIGLLALTDLETDLATHGLKICWMPRPADGYGACAGVGGGAEIVGVCDTPFGINGCNGVVRLTVLRDSSEMRVPLLFPINLQEALGFNISLPKNKISFWFADQYFCTDMVREPSAHRSISIVDFGPEGWSLPEEALAELGGTNPFEFASIAKDIDTNSETSINRKSYTTCTYMSEPDSSSNASVPVCNGSSVGNSGGPCNLVDPKFEVFQWSAPDSHLYETACSDCKFISRTKCVPTLKPTCQNCNQSHTLVRLVRNPASHVMFSDTVQFQDPTPHGDPVTFSPIRGKPILSTGIAKQVSKREPVLSTGIGPRVGILERSICIGENKAEHVTCDSATDQAVFSASLSASKCNESPPASGGDGEERCGGRGVGDTSHTGPGGEAPDEDPLRMVSHGHAYHFHVGGCVEGVSAGEVDRSTASAASLGDGSTKGETTQDERRRPDRKGAYESGDRTSPTEEHSPRVCSGPHSVPTPNASDGGRRREGRQLLVDLQTLRQPMAEALGGGSRGVGGGELVQRWTANPNSVEEHVDTSECLYSKPGEECSIVCPKAQDSREGGTSGDQENSGSPSVRSGEVGQGGSRVESWEARSSSSSGRFHAPAGSNDLP